MNTNDFDFDLPEELIAQTPLEKRDASKLLILDRKTGRFQDRHFDAILDELETGDALVMNNTRVLPARLHGIKPETGGHVEFLLLKNTQDDCWEVLAKPAKRLKVGASVSFGDGRLTATVEEELEHGGRIVRFHYQGERYQTVYAKENGSAAAPTAGLHFTQELLQKIEAKGVHLVYLTLHVGLGTFRPVSVDNLEDHEMHSEFYQLSEEAAATLRQVKAAKKRIIAVGTTSIRTLETIGNKFAGDIKADSGWTNIFIKPGYEWKIVDAFSTNFHLPKSTLVMLVSAFAGRELTLEAYHHAIQERYRFFSFGDAMFIK